MPSIHNVIELVCGGNLIGNLIQQQKRGVLLGLGSQKQVANTKLPKQIEKKPQIDPVRTKPISHVWVEAIGSGQDHNNDPSTSRERWLYDMGIVKGFFSVLVLVVVGGLLLFVTVPGRLVMIDN